MSIPDKCGWCDRPPDADCQRQPCHRTSRADTVGVCPWCETAISTGQLQVLTEIGRLHLWCEDKWLHVAPTGVGAA